MYTISRVSTLLALVTTLACAVRIQDISRNSIRKWGLKIVGNEKGRFDFRKNGNRYRGDTEEDPFDGSEDTSKSKTADGTEVVEQTSNPENGPVRTREIAPDTSGLQDIGVASFRNTGQEVVIGTDDRIRINRTADYPWRVHASLLITAKDGQKYIGTAWFACPDTLITAGHAVFIRTGRKASHGWVRNILVMPGRNKDKLPFGSAYSTEFYSVKEWTEEGRRGFDYGAIKLKTDLGKKTGWLGIKVYRRKELLGSIANIAGYPGDKPTGTQWYHKGRVSRVNRRRIFYDADTYKGQSGSAVYRIEDSKRYAFAIHAYGGQRNSGTRITRKVFKNIETWCDI